MKEAKSGKDVERYKAAIKALGEIMLAVEDIVPDTAWVDKTTRQVKIESERLEAELRGYKNNLIKESIRVRTEIESGGDHTLTLSFIDGA